MYRVTAKQHAKLKAMRDAKERKRMNSPSPDYPSILPDLRRTIIIIDYDNGVYDQHQIDLYRTGRIDQFRAVVDGVEWKRRIGFSGVLAGIRKSMPRVQSNA
jgi:hypothetical protein